MTFPSPQGADRDERILALAERIFVHSRAGHDYTAAEADEWAKEALKWAAQFYETAERFFAGHPLPQVESVLDEEDP